MTKRLTVGIAGLGFGAEFIPIYQAHPDTELVAVCRRDSHALAEVASRFDVPRRYTDFNEMLNDPEIDAVHINTPIPDHAEQTVAALEAGKHVACTVPMATSIDDCAKIVAVAEESGRTYMMMETAVYTREFLYVRSLRDNGQLGRIQFVRGAHHQDMAGWPGYWEGLPPMHYATHAIAPLLAITGTLADSVSCLGSGRIADMLSGKYGSPFAVETALVKLRDSDVAAEVSRSLFATARQYVENFTVLGSRESFEWEQTEGSGHVIFRGEQPTRPPIRDFGHLLPTEIANFTRQGVYDADQPHLSFIQGNGHGGSHPHLVNEFVRSIIDDRPPSVDAITAANWTAVGLCAHESARQGGSCVTIPDFAASTT